MVRNIPKRFVTSPFHLFEIKVSNTLGALLKILWPKRIQRQQ
jgi:hypothetical protein